MIIYNIINFVSNIEDVINKKSDMKDWNKCQSFYILE